MDNIEVSLLRSRIRLPRDGAGGRAWLDRVDAIRDDLTGTNLEPALAPFAMTSEVICVRRIALPLRLRGAVTDRQASLQWSDEIAAELRRILARNAPEDVLRFPHELAARQAFLADTLTAESGRDWAWRQLAWLPAGTAVDARARLDAAIAAGIADPELIVPMLRHVAALDLLPALAEVLDDVRRGRLLSAALTGLPVEAAAALARWATDAMAVAVPSPAAAFSPAAPNHAFLALLRALPAPVERRVWAVLGLLCCEPYRLRAAPAEAAGLAQAWLRSALEVPAAASARSMDTETEGPPVSPTSQTPARTSRVFPSASAPAVPAPNDEPDALPRVEQRDGPAARPGAIGDEGMTARTPITPAGPVEGETAFGGLLFLLPLAAGIGALDRLLNEPVLAAWPLAAMLHRLARTLLPPLAAADPAALAFAGLPPNAEPPSAAQSGDWRRRPEPAAKAALGAAAGMVIAELTRRLPHWAGPALVQRVAERQAVIAADPGWIEVRLRLADVSTDLRRVALDLDPGFLPWLGIVLTYRYA